MGKKQFVVLSKNVLHPDSHRPTMCESYHLKVLDEMDGLIYQTSVASDRNTVCESDMRGMGDLMASLDKYEVHSLRTIAKYLVRKIPDRIEYEPNTDLVFTCSDHAEKCQDYGSRYRYGTTSQKFVNLVKKELRNLSVRKQISELEEKLE